MPDNRDEDNPFAVSELFKGARDNTANVPAEAWYEVDGDCIRCGPKVQLPAVCVLTGSLEKLTRVTLPSTYPAFRFVLRSRRCLVECCVSSRIFLYRSIVSGLGTALMVLSPIIAMNGVSVRDWSFGLLLATVPAGLLLVATSRIRLTLDRYDAPHSYRVAGISAAAVKVLKELQPATDERF